MPHTRTKAQVLQEFASRGISLAAWARARGYSVPLVYQVLSGEKRGLRGQSHAIAVELGLKRGVIAGLDDLPFSDGARKG